MMKHTQGEWEVDGITGKIMKEGSQVAKANTYDIANSIVNACNSALELLWASKHALADLEYCKSKHKNDEQDSQFLQATLNQLKQVISKAEK